MLENVIAYLALSVGGPKLIDKIGRGIFNKLQPPVVQARVRAIENMATELEGGYPSANFLKMNFHFDSKELRDELYESIDQSDLENSDRIKSLMAEWVLKQRTNFEDPDLINEDDANEIVDCFLKHFEIECLKMPELSGYVLKGIIEGQHLTTQSIISEEAEFNRKLILEVKELIESERGESQNRSSSSILDESIRPEVLNQLEESYIDERDEIVDSIKKWDYQEIEVKISKLANNLFETYKDINSEVAASIFRLYGSYLIRTKNDHEHASKWIELANELEPKNHKTIGLTAELLISKSEWQNAKEILEPIADTTEVSFVKILYAECLYRISGSKVAKSWLLNQEPKDDELNLNLAIFSIKDGDLDTPYNILEELKKKSFPGPYPFLYSAELLMKRAQSGAAKIQIAMVEEVAVGDKQELIQKATIDLEKAIELFQAAARPQKNIAFTALSLSELYLNIQDTSSGEKHLIRYWRELRKISKAWFAAASISLIKGDHDKALFRANKALKLSKEHDQETLLRYVLVCLNAEKWDLCLSTIEKCNIDAIEDEYIKALLQIKAVCYYNKLDYQSAEKNLLELKEKFPDDESWLLTQTIGLKKRNKVSEAIELIEKEKSNYPDSDKLKLRLSHFYCEVGEFARALEILKECEEAYDDVNYYEYASQIALAAGMPDEAMHIIERANAKDKHSETLDHYKAITLTMQGNYKDAVKVFSESDSSSFSAQDYFYYALSFYHDGLKTEALELLQEATTIYPKDPLIISHLAFVYVESDRKKAFDVARKWLKLDPENKEAYKFTMQIGFAIGEQKIAHEVMMNYLSRFGESADFRSVAIEEAVSLHNEKLELGEKLWTRYQEGLMPELIVSEGARLGGYGFRFIMFASKDRIMAFDGNLESKALQYFNTLNEDKILLDYHSLIDIHELNLLDSLVTLDKKLCIPQIVKEKLVADLNKLKLSIQSDVREQHEVVIEALPKFEVDAEYPQISIDTLHPKLGNLTYDILTCQGRRTFYVLPGFDADDHTIINEEYGIECISILDLLDVMKSSGFIKVTEYSAALDSLKVHNLRNIHNLSSIPNNLTFNWQSLLILAQCGLLEGLHNISSTIHVGPFSNSLINNYLEDCKLVDNIHSHAKNLEDRLNDLISGEQIEIIQRSKEIKNDTEEHDLPGKEYIDQILQTSQKQSLLLLTDDLALKKLAESENIKTTDTRVMLSVLNDTNVIDRELYIENVIQLIRWGMYYCNLDIRTILECAALYSYTMSPDFKAIIQAVTTEMQDYPDKIPDHVQRNNFKFFFNVIEKLWVISADAQSLAMRIFDEVIDVIKTKPVLQKFWIEMSIYRFALYDQKCLEDFLRFLSLRLSDSFLIEDQLKDYLIEILNICRSSDDSLFIHSGRRHQVADRISNAIRIALPGYNINL